MKRLVSLSFILIQWSVITLGEETNITITNLNETDFKDTDFKNASILRYGHHRINCIEFKKAYVCIMMCLEKGYDIAHSKKDCSCHCFKDEVKAKYFAKVSPGWMIPTTSKPAWARGTSIKVKMLGGEYLYTSGEGDSEKSDKNGTKIKNDTVDDQTEHTANQDADETHDGEEPDEEGHAEEENYEEENSEGENAEGENAEGENAEGENAEGENAEGENPEGENAEGENPEGENAEGENAEGENAEGE